MVPSWQQPFLQVRPFPTGTVLNGHNTSKQGLSNLVAGGSKDRYSNTGTRPAPVPRLVLVPGLTPTLTPGLTPALTLAPALTPAIAPAPALALAIRSSAFVLPVPKYRYSCTPY